MQRRPFIRCAAAGAAWLSTGHLTRAEKPRPGNKRPSRTPDPARLAEIAAMPSLAEAYRWAFPVGVAVAAPVPDGYTPEELALVARQFGIITPGNCMKWRAVQKGLDDWQFGGADAFVRWVEAHKLKTLGHCLVWNRPEHDPHWLFKGKSGEPVSKRQALARLQRSIETIVGRYKGRLDSWDVVNEAIGPTSSGSFLRETQWTKFTGADFIETAYRAAHRADPGVRLAYNDYNTEYDWRRKRIIELVKGLQDKGIPIGIVGIQGHYELDDIPYQKIEQSIVELHEETGARIAVTELDLDMVPRRKWWSATPEERVEMAKRNPYPHTCPAEVLERQADQYEKLFRIFLKHRGKMDRVTFWGFTDNRSWLNKWPWERVNHPLLFDAAARPKPAFFRLLELAKSRNIKTEQ